MSTVRRARRSGQIWEASAAPSPGGGCDEDGVGGGGNDSDGDPDADAGVDDGVAEYGKRQLLPVVSGGCDGGDEDADWRGADCGGDAGPVGWIGDDVDGENEDAGEEEILLP